MEKLDWQIIEELLHPDKGSRLIKDRKIYDDLKLETCLIDLDKLGISLGALILRGRELHITGFILFHIYEMN